MKLTGNGTQRRQTIPLGALALAVAAAAGLPSAAHAGILSKATAGPDGASSAAIQLGDGLVVLGGSRADETGARWDPVAIGGETVIGRQATPDGTQNEWAGLLADLGPAIDDVNGATCDGEANHCVALLPGSAYANSNGGGANGSLAVILVSDEGGSTGLAVANSQAGGSDLDCARTYADARPVAYAINGEAASVDESTASHADC